MAILKCKMCGGELQLIEGTDFCECEFCGTKQTVPTADNEKKITLFDRANRLRMKAEFDKAAAVYESIVTEFPEEAEGYWGLCLCKYGIEYVDDPQTGKKVPTCHRTSFDGIFKDPNFEMAQEYSDGIARNLYREEAKEIDRLQKAIIEVAQKEDPFNIFICYKETDENGNRTKDSVRAQEIYNELTKAGYKVFFSRITLEDKLGEAYEPYIFSALNSSKIMLAIGTKYDYYNAVWVKNEWSRFLQMMKNDPSKKLIPCYSDIDAYDMPEEFSNLQGQDMAKIGFLQDLLRGIDKIMGKGQIAEKKKENEQANTQTVTADNLLRRGYLSLEDKDWEKAKELFDNVLNIDAENAEAYLGMMLVEKHYPDKIAFSKEYIESGMEEDRYFKRAKQFASGEFKKWIEQLEKEREDELLRDQKQKEDERKKDLENREKIVSVLESIRKRNGLVKDVIQCGHRQTVGLKADGTVVAVGDNEYGQCNVSDWRDIVAIDTDGSHTVGLRNDGTVVAVGDNEYGQCNVSDWRDIVAIATSTFGYTVGLKADGTVVAVGYNQDGQCNVSDWRNIVAIAAGGDHTAGLRSDGTVVAVGDNEYDQCNVSDWRNIVAIAADESYTVGLRTDGTVVAVGDNEYGQCDVSDWRDIVAIDTDGSHTVGLRNDGAVVAVGDNEYGQCDVSDWRDIVAISVDLFYTVGLRSDGTVVAVGENNESRCDVTSWRDIVAIATSQEDTAGLKSDGTVIVAGENYCGECNVSNWKLFNNIS